MALETKNPIMHSDVEDPLVITMYVKSCPNLQSSGPQIDTCPGLSWFRAFMAIEDLGNPRYPIPFLNLNDDDLMMICKSDAYSFSDSYLFAYCLADDNLNKTMYILVCSN